MLNVDKFNIAIKIETISTCISQENLHLRKSAFDLGQKTA